MESNKEMERKWLIFWLNGLVIRHIYRGCETGCQYSVIDRQIPLFSYGRNIFHSQNRGEYHQSLSDRHYAYYQ